MQAKPNHQQRIRGGARRILAVALACGLVASAWALDRVLVAAQGTDEVLLYENDGGTWSFLSVFADANTPGTGFPLDNPGGIAVSPDGSRVYIGEAIPDFGRVLCFSADGTFVKTVAEDTGFVGNGEFSGQPYDLEFGPDGRLYMSTAFGDLVERIYAIDVDTNNVSIFVDTTGTGYSLAAPLGITFVDGDLYVANRGDDLNTIDPPGNDEILVFQGPAGGSPGAFVQTFWNLTNKPKDVFFDSLTGDLFFGATAPGAFIQFTEPGVSDANVPLAGSQNPYEFIRSEGFIHYTGGENNIVRLSADGSSTANVVSGLSATRGMAILETLPPDVWDGGAANDNLSTAVNWEGDLAPTFTDSILVFTGSTRLTPNNDVVGASIDRITFDPNASAFTIGGNGFTLNRTITNSSANLQTISTGQILGNDSRYICSDGDLAVTSAVDIGVNGVSFGGRFVTTMSGVLSGTDGLEIGGFSGQDSNGDEQVGTGETLLVLPTNNANSFNGGIFINSGVLRVSNAGQLSSAEINVANQAAGTRLDIDGSGGNVTLGNTFNLKGRGTTGVGPEDAVVNNLAGDNVLSGTINLDTDNGETLRSFLFRADSGSLTINNTPNVIGTFTNTISLRSAGVATINFPFALGDLAGNPSGIVAVDNATLRLTNAANTYTDLTRIVSNATVALSAASTNNIPNTSNIVLVDPNTTLDVSGLTNGEIILSPNNTFLGGRGTIVGGLVAGTNNRVRPGATSGSGDTLGTLTITGGLTLNDGVTISIDAGQTADLIQLTGGTLTGSASAGGITLVIESLEGFPQPDAIPLIDFNGLPTSNLDVSDFTLDLTAVTGVIPTAEVRIVNDQVVLDISTARVDVNGDLAVNADDWLLLEPCVLGPGNTLPGLNSALRWDNQDPSGNVGRLFANFTQTTDFSVTPMTVSFDALKRRTGSGKNARFILQDPNGVEALRVVFRNGSNEWTLSVDGGVNETSIITGGGAAFFNEPAWDPNAAWQANVTLDSSGIDVTVITRDGSIGTLTDQPVGVSTIVGRMEMSTQNVSGIEGTWLDNIFASVSGVGTVFDDNFNDTSLGAVTLADLNVGIADGVGTWTGEFFDEANADIIAAPTTSDCTLANFLRLDADTDGDVDMSDLESFNVNFTEANP